MESEVRVNLGGRDTVAAFVSEHEMEDGRVLQTYSLQDGGTLELTIRFLEKELEASWVPVEGALRLQIGSATEVLKIEGGCGC